MSEDVKLTEEQRKALVFVIGKLLTGSRLIALAGSAGTGKTTILKHLVAYLESKGEEVIVAATTHKAARVLGGKGLPAVTSHSATCRPVFEPPYDILGSLFDALSLGVQVDMTHEAIVPLKAKYKAKFDIACSRARSSGIYAGFRALGITDSSDYIRGFAARAPRTGILIIDEASMLGGTDAAKAQEVFSRIVLVGDENQLPPVQDEPIFWKVPERIALTHIHRQAEGSQPLRIAQTLLKDGNKIALKSSKPIDLRLCRKGVPIIVWRNETREKLTLAIRQKLGIKSRNAVVGEFLVCRNVMDKLAKSRGLINNSIWKVVEIDNRRYSLEGEDGSIVKNQLIHMEETKAGKGIPFRFLYAITAHSAQGSEFPRVMIHTPDGRAYFRHDPKEARKWLYTACTRAQREVIFVSSEVE